ncbi:hypothetical protein HMPREF3232_00209 [Fannyhessea vaginae]|nr:hypothetical protein HMPREF3232_00209 [Fannyhessea vaginae]
MQSKKNTIRCRRNFSNSMIHICAHNRNILENHPRACGNYLGK